LVGETNYGDERESAKKRKETNRLPKTTCKQTPKLCAKKTSREFWRRELRGWVDIFETETQDLEKGEMLTSEPPGNW